MHYKILVALALCSCAAALNVPPSWARGGIFASYNIKPAAENSEIPELTYDMPLDHFNASSKETFKLRYWIDDSCYKPNGPIFFNMGGEAEAAAARCDDRAEKLGATVVAYEHRFYGQSVPAGDLADANMPFLSVEQNLADANLLVNLVKKSDTKYANAKVVAFGGSYSGATCAWFRVAYPQTIVGCVSSSGVVNAIEEFVGFDETISEATTHPSPQCHIDLAAAFAAVDRAFAAGQGNDIKVLFNATNLQHTPLGDTDFFYAIADAAAMLVQYGSKDMLCSVLAQLPPSPTDSQRIENLGALINLGYGSEFTKNCFYDSECLQDPTAPTTGVGNRQWRWQKCSQLAYFQIAPHTGDVMRSRNLTIDALRFQCEYVFGKGTLPDVEKFDRKYGGATPKATNVFFLDFSDDPWKRASVDHSEGSTMQFCMTTCDGCGHCGAGVSRALMKRCDDEATSQIYKWLGLSETVL